MPVIARHRDAARTLSVNLLQFLKDTLSALRFFTRLPWPGAHDADRSLAATAAAFPLAGAMIGALIAAVFLATSTLFPAGLAAGLAVGFGLYITGALHEDGLSDCADGLGGTPKRDRALEIMRDSRIGTYGACALFLSVGLRWAALASLLPWQGAAALIVAHSVSRASIVIALSQASYAREKGLGEMVSEGASRETMLMALAVAAIAAMLATAPFGLLPVSLLAGLIATCIGVATAYIMLRKLISRLGGYTGDGLGAMQQVSEIAVLLSFTAIWN